MKFFNLEKNLNQTSSINISSKKHFDLFFHLNSNHIISPLSNDFKAMPRQKYADLYTINGALYLSSRKSIFLNKSLFSPSTLGYIMPQKYSIDIDTELDWDIAQFLMKKEL